MCGGGGGGGGGGGVSNNRPVSRPPPLSIERPPSFDSPKNPAVSLNQDDVFVGNRTPKRAKPREKSVIDKAVDTVRQLVGRVADGVKQIGRGATDSGQPEVSEPAPVIPR